MAEESGKGIALVILGIVAIIAIVGLVLLFTGAKKTTGEFAVPSAKEYGGAIRGVMDPTSRAFSGRSYTFPSGVNEGYSSLGGQQVTKLTNTPGGVYGEVQTIKGEDNQKFLSYNRDYSEIPSIIAATWLGALSGMPNLNQPADVNEARAYMDQGRFCKATSSFNAVDLAVAAEEYGLTRNNVQEFIDSAQASGMAYICESPTLGGTV